MRPTSLGKMLDAHEEDEEMVFRMPDRVLALRASAAVGPGGSPLAPPVMATYAPEAAAAPKPYLVLDIRTEEEFDDCHIVEARSYPSPLFHHDRISPELHSYKNKEDRLIILYVLLSA
jgi:hypothetical protein